jgi:hypothetical protein
LSSKSLWRGFLLPNSEMNPRQWVKALHDFFNDILAHIHEDIDDIHNSLNKNEINQAIGKIIQIGLFAKHDLPNLSVAYADNIDSIQPTIGCCNQTLIINGNGFGEPSVLGLKNGEYSDNIIHPFFDILVIPRESHPYDKVLLLPTRSSEVECTHPRIATVPMGKWEDTKIEIPLPEWIGIGSVGFLNLKIQQEWNIYTEELNRLLADIFMLIGPIIFPEKKGSIFDDPLSSYIPTLTPPLDTPPFTKHNFLIAGRPIIRSFHINDLIHCTIEPNNWSSCNQKIMFSKRRRI